MSIRKRYMQTVSGLTIYPDDPKGSINAISLYDIAHALSGTNRFGGHTTSFYSVASHSIWCCKTALDTYGNLNLALYLLMHDAAEAYLGDMPTPIKDILPSFSELEDKWLSVIHKILEVPWLCIKEMEQAHYIDNLALLTEACVLQTNQTWISEEKENEIEMLKPTIEFLTPEESTLEFIELYHTLRCKIKLEIEEKLACPNSLT